MDRKSYFSYATNRTRRAFKIDKNVCIAMQLMIWNQQLKA